MKQQRAASQRDLFTGLQHVARPDHAAPCPEAVGVPGTTEKKIRRILAAFIRAHTGTGERIAAKGRLIDFIRTVD